mgnify:CR=1 FL=1
MNFVWMEKRNSRSMDELFHLKFLLKDVFLLKVVYLLKDELYHLKFLLKDEYLRKVVFLKKDEYLLKVVFLRKDVYRWYYYHNFHCYGYGSRY